MAVCRPQTSARHCTCPISRMERAKLHAGRTTLVTLPAGTSPASHTFAQPSAKLSQLLQLVSCYDPARPGSAAAAASRAAACTEPAMTVALGAAPAAAHATRVRTAAAWVKQQIAAHDSSHDWFHIERVTNAARSLAAAEGLPVSAACCSLWQPLVLPSSASSAHASCRICSARCGCQQGVRSSLWLPAAQQ